MDTHRSRVFAPIICALIITAACSCRDAEKSGRLYDKGVEAYHRKNLDEAADFFQRSLREDSGRAEAKLMLAKIGYYRRDFTRARSHLSDILEDSPDHVSALYWLARTLIMDTGNDTGAAPRSENQAVALLQNVISVDESHIGARSLLALIFEKRRMYREAIVQYRRILGEEETLVSARANLALLFRRMGLHDRSKAELDIAGSIADSAGLKKDIIRLIREEAE